MAWLTSISPIDAHGSPTRRFPGHLHCADLGGAGRTRRRAGDNAVIKRQAREHGYATSREWKFCSAERLKSRNALCRRSRRPRKDRQAENGTAPLSRFVDLGVASDVGRNRRLCETISPLSPVTRPQIAKHRICLDGPVLPAFFAAVPTCSMKWLQAMRFWGGGGELVRIWSAGSPAKDFIKCCNLRHRLPSSAIALALGFAHGAQDKPGPEAVYIAPCPLPSTQIPVESHRRLAL